MNFQNSTKLAVAGLSVSAIALLGMPEVAQASKECGLFEGTIQGQDWVSRCPAGVDIFPNSWAVIDLWLLNPDGSMGTFLNDIMIQGPATITRMEGRDDNGGIIETAIVEELRGFFPGFGEIILGGNGTGAITDQSTDAIDQPAIPNDGRADSFFDVFAEIDLPSLNTTWKAKDPVRVVGDRPLIGVSPDRILSPYDPSYPAAIQIQQLMQNPECPTYDPLDEDTAIAYYGCDPIDLFAPGPDGIFDTLDDEKVAILHGEVHIVHPADPTIPEPSSTIAFVATLGAAIFGLKRKPKKDS